MHDYDYIVVVQVTPDKFRFSNDSHGEAINLAYIYSCYSSRLIRLASYMWLLTGTVVPQVKFNPRPPRQI